MKQRIRRYPLTFTGLFFREMGWNWVHLVLRSSFWLTAPAPDDRWVWSSWWNDNWQGKPKYSEELCRNATFSTTNPTWLDLGSNLGCRGGKATTICLSYGMAISLDLMALYAGKQNFHIHRWENLKFSIRLCSLHRRLLALLPSGWVRGQFRFERRDDRWDTNCKIFRKKALMAQSRFYFEPEGRRFDSRLDH
jgi:hypothetical protein